MEKIIHYCWFGTKPLGKLEKKCIKSWQKYFPDYKIMKWSEENVNLEECEFIREAYKNKKWAYVADYVRTKALYEYGGIYFDTDMEVIKKFDDSFDKDLVLGLEDSTRPNAAIVIAKKHNKYLKKLLDKYKKMKFNPTGDLFDTCIPKLLEELLLPVGLVCGSKEIQILDKSVYVYPRDYFYPLSYDMQDNVFTDNTYTIHHFSASWTDTGEKITVWLKRHKLKFLVQPLWSICNLLKKFKNKVFIWKK